MFERTWGGTELGCNFPEIDPLVGFTVPAEVRTYTAWLDDRDGRKECRPSEQIQPIPAVVQDELPGGFYICGTRGGDAFETVTRPDTAGQCPENTEPCSTKTSPENTVCYPPEDHDAKCPITHIMIMKQALT